MAMCVMAVVAVAPCQCFSPGGIQITSPGRISSIGPPQRWARPQPAVTIRVWPSGWVCHRSEEHTSELQSQSNLVCRLLLEKKKKNKIRKHNHTLDQHNSNY